MKPANLYLALCVLGTALPYRHFVPWVAEHGFAPQLFLEQLFANRVGAFFGADVIISAIVLVVFMRLERARQPIRWPWLPVGGLLLVGVSLGFPLFLYLREQAPDQTRART